MTTKTTSMNIPGIDRIPPHLRKPLFILVGVGALFWITIAGYALFRESPRDIAKQIQAQADAIAAESIANAKEEAARLRREQAELEVEQERSKLEQAKKKKAELAEKEAKDAADSERVAKTMAERKQREAEEKAVADAKRQAQKDREAQEKMAKMEKEAAIAKARAEADAAEQVKLQEIAARLFGEVNLQPKVTMSPNLKSLSSTWEIKGEPLSTLKSLYAAKDWLGVYNLADKSQEKKLPNEALVGHAVSDLKEIRLKLVLRTSFSPRLSGDELKGIFVWKFSPGHLMFDQINPDPHPDGIGYIFDWPIKHQNVHLTLGGKNIIEGIDQFEREYSDQVSKLETKHSLTELTAEQLEAELNKLDSALLKKVADWVDKTR